MADVILQGHGRPNVFLAGKVGQKYKDLDSGLEWVCTGERGFIKVDGDDQSEMYNWELVESGGSTGGVSSWNDLTDKPFEAPKVYEFDGNTEGLDSFNDGRLNYYKVSDDVLTTEQLAGGALTMLSGGTQSATFEIPSNGIYEGPGCLILEGVYIFYNYQESSTASGVSAPSNGIYFGKSDNITVTKITTHAKTIDKSCLPPIDKADLPAIEVDDLPSVPFSKIKGFPVVMFTVSLATLVGSSQPTLDIFYDGYTLEELLTCIQSGRAIFETRDGVRMFTITTNYNDTYLFVSLLVIYNQKLYSVELVCKKSDGSFFRNSLHAFTAV